MYIAQEDILTAEEGLARAQDVNTVVMTLIREVEGSNPQVKKRAPARCSKCDDTDIEPLNACRINRYFL